MYRAHAPPQGACENLVCVLKLLASLQAGGDNVVATIFEGLSQWNRVKITSELGSFIDVDSQEAVKIGDLERHKVIELTLRAGDAQCSHGRRTGGVGNSVLQVCGDEINVCSPVWPGRCCGSSTCKTQVSR